MAFDELTRKRIDNHVGALCRKLTDPKTADQLAFEYDIDGNAVSIYEVRPPWDGRGEKTRMGVARFRYFESKQEWRLYWMRRDLKWHLYDPDVAVNSRLEVLVDIVERDRNGAFFG